MFNANLRELYTLERHPLELVRNLMAHAQKPDFVFRLNGRVHLNRRGSQFSRLLAAEVSASALVMLDTPRSEVVWVYWLPIPLASFPFTSPPVRHRVPPHSERSIPIVYDTEWAPRPVWTGAGNFGPHRDSVLLTVQSVASRYTDWAIPVR